METRAWRSFGPLVHPYISPGSWQPKQSKPFVAEPTSEMSEDVEPTVEILGADEHVRAAPNAYVSTVDEVEFVVAKQETNGQAYSAQITEKLKSGKGIVPEVEAEELVAQYAGEHTKAGQTPKEWWQDKARTVGVTELNRHIRGSRGLALLYVNARNAAGMTEREWTEWREMLEAAGSGNENRSADVVDRELPSILEEIANAPDNKALSDIWCRYRDARGVEAAERDILKAGTDRMEAIRKAQLVASDSPFA